MSTCVHLSWLLYFTWCCYLFWNVHYSHFHPFHNQLLSLCIFSITPRLPNTLSSPLLLHPTYSRISLYLLTFSLWGIHTDNIKHHPFHFQLQTHDSVWHSSPTTLITYSSFKITPGLATIFLSILSYQAITPLFWAQCLHLESLLSLPYSCLSFSLADMS